MRARHSLEVRLTTRGEVDPAGEEISTLLFRSVQELLLNVVKHAGVKSADLRLEVRGDLLRIRVADRGKGFNAEKVETEPGAGGFGLFSIHERMSLVGGRMELRSTPGTGSRCTLVVPLASLRPEGGKSATPGPAPRRRAPRKMR
jgi:signal transduction histidine kinase